MAYINFRIVIQTFCWVLWRVNRTAYSQIINKRRKGSLDKELSTTKVFDEISGTQKLVWSLERNHSLRYFHRPTQDAELILGNGSGTVTSKSCKHFMRLLLSLLTTPKLKGKFA